jgi:surfeit locus 1 family protein
MSGTPLTRLFGVRGAALRLAPASSSRSLRTSAAPRASQASQQYDSLYSSAYSGQGARTDQPKWYRSPTTLLLGFIPLFTLGLGVWQMQRLSWKLELIDELEQKLTLQPVQLPMRVE